MVLKSVHMRLRTEEVPVRFLKDREGRRQPPQAVGLVFAVGRRHGSTCARCSSTARTSSCSSRASLFLALGLLLTLPLSFGPVTIGPITFSLYWMLLGVSLAVLGLQCVYMGCLAQVFFDYTGRRRRALASAFPTPARCVASGGVFAGRAALLVVAARRRRTVANGFTLPEPAERTITWRSPACCS